MNKYKDLEIFGFSGKIGVGKNYILENIFLPMLPVKQTVVLAFADQFKIDVVAKDKIPYENAFHKKTDESRVKLQHRGTEEGRNVYGADVWVDVIDAWIQTHYERGIRRIILTDCRFVNECDYIKKMGGKLIRVNASDRNYERLLQESNGNLDVLETLKNHISENLLDDYTNFDYILDNSKQNLDIYNNVRDMVIDINEKGKHNKVIFCDLDDTICHCYSYYVEVLNNAITKCKEYIKPKFHAEFTVAFKEVLGFQERNMQTHYIYKERYAESIVNSFNKFSHMFIEDFDILDATKQIYNIGMSVFKYEYKPLGNAVDVIKDLNERYKVVFITVGAREEQVKKLAQLGLTKIDFEIFDHKDEFVFRNLCNKYKANTYAMIGDSIVRDVEPSLKLNFDLVLHIDRNMSVEKIKMSNNHYKVNHISQINEII